MVLASKVVEVQRIWGQSPLKIASLILGLKVDGFIALIKAFNRCENVSNENAGGTQ